MFLKHNSPLKKAVNEHALSPVMWIMFPVDEGALSESVPTLHRTLSKYREPVQVELVTIINCRIRQTYEVTFVAFAIRVWVDKFAPTNLLLLLPCVSRHKIIPSIR